MFFFCSERVIDGSFCFHLTPEFLYSVITDSFAADVGNRIRSRESNTSHMSNRDSMLTITPWRSVGRIYDMEPARDS